MKNSRLLSAVATITLLLSALAFSATPPRQSWQITLPSPQGSSFCSFASALYLDGKGGCAFGVWYYGPASQEFPTGTLIDERLFWITSKGQVRMIDFDPSAATGIFRLTPTALYIYSSSQVTKVTSDAKGNLTQTAFGNPNDSYQAGTANDTLGFFSLNLQPVNSGVPIAVPAIITRWTN
jgi:hypothetical protein